MFTHPTGPWKSATVFTLTVPVVSKSNHRHSRAASSWGRFKGFEDAVTFESRTALPETWPDLAADRPLKERPTVVLVIVASTMIDASNLPKSIADALEGVCYINDASARATVSLAERSTVPHAVVAVAALAPDAPFDALVSAQSELTNHAVRWFRESLPPSPAV